MLAGQYLALFAGVAAGYSLGLLAQSKYPRAGLFVHPVPWAVILGALAATGVTVVRGPVGEIEWVGEIVHLRSQDDLDAFVRETNEGRALVEAYALWCPQCRTMTPDMNKAAKTGHRVAVFNVDANRDISEELSIEMLPTVIVFDNGREIGRLLGAQSASTLIEVLESGKNLAPQSRL